MILAVMADYRRVNDKNTIVGMGKAWGGTHLAGTCRTIVYSQSFCFILSLINSPSFHINELSFK